MTTPPEQLYPLILDSIADGVFTVDAEFRLTSLNAEAERITGVSREHAIGRHCYEVLRGSGCQQGCPLKRSIETGAPEHDVPMTMLDANMEPVPICVSTAVMRDADGRLVGGVEVIRDVSEIESLRDQLAGRAAVGGLVGSSPAMREVLRLIDDVATTDVSVLIEAESGTGKELVARAIHDQSKRADAPFVSVNCGALPDALLESELFGYVRGAFTDARHDKPGRFQQASGGTLFLDEVGDLSAAFQVKLLRALQEGEVTPLGATEAVEVDVRVIAATNRNLGELMQAGQFRQDLYYRLCVVPITIAPLRDRRDDIVPLIQHMMPRIALRTGSPARELTPAARTALYDYDYPGNVRELRNILERALVLSHGERIDLADLPPAVARNHGEQAASSPPRAAVPPPPSTPVDSEPTDPSRRPLKPSERRLLAHSGDTDLRASSTAALSRERPEVQQLIQALDAHHWSRSETAQALGISRSTLWRRMKDYGLG
ncbi:MAG: sigma 54-interacting transcriptional regulator [Deltaproteobacteria bacterium]|jgi:PAS domain S-box-containing protein|nr:sigma 54-interacting transcriptional regulator [Deltaproteobacteria bacterium]MBW2537803.1 sigma 54-interacting transcriptional regulator [Deltaproteobacteria bacterium]